MKSATTSKRKRLRAVDRTFARVFEGYRPPENLAVSEWAAKYRVLSSESSAEAGRWRNERTPYLVEPMDAFSDARVRRITMVAASQVGKSEFILNCIGYAIDQAPGSMLYIQPNIEDAKKFSRRRIAPMIRECSRLKDKVADAKGRDSANTVQEKSFPGGALSIIGSNSPAALASTPVRYVFGDERDRWARSAGTEGDPWGLAEARTITYHNAKLVDVSTPTTKGDSPIADAYYSGTQEHWCIECPHCGEWHDIVFNDIKIDFETIEGKKRDYIVKSVAWCCPSCGCLVSERQAKNQPARWIAGNPDAMRHGHRSFWLNSFVSPWVTWDSIVYDFLKARHDPLQLKVVYNTKLGQLWEERGDLATEDTMLARREDYGTREDGTPIDLPDGALVLTCAVDTQDDRLEYEVVGWGHYDENWGIQKGVIMGDPNYDEPWERLDDVLDHIYRFESNRGLSISITFVDSGGHKTQSVYRHCHERLHKRVFAVKGKGGDGIPYTKLPSKVKMVTKGQTVGLTWLYTIGVDSGKAEILNGMLKVQEPGPKYCHFPNSPERGYDINYFNGLLSEVYTQRVERGRVRLGWAVIPGHERNEPLDLRNYNLAAFRTLAPDMDAVERRLKGFDEPRSQSKQTARQRSRGAVRNSITEGSDW